MDFGFSEEQEMMRQSARQFLEAECQMSYVRKMMEDDGGYSAAQWKKMAELGWMGLIFPEEYGGSGLTMVDLVVILEEMGPAAPQAGQVIGVAAQGFQGQAGQVVKVHEARVVAI